MPEGLDRPPPNVECRKALLFKGLTGPVLPPAHWHSLCLVHSAKTQHSNYNKNTKR